MKRSLLILIFLAINSFMFAQISGTKTIPGDYATLNAAIQDLNGNGVGPGGVIFNIAAGYTETITAPLSLTITGTASDPIVFQKSGVGNNPKITANTGTATPSSAIQDGIWQLVGVSYVTIDGIDLYDPNSTNPATMEYGFGMFLSSSIKGCQHNTIKNCTVTLNRNNNANAIAPSAAGSRAIEIINAISYSQTIAQSPSTAVGTNSYNKIYSNTLQNCNYGVAIYGNLSTTSPYTNADHGNDIGGNSYSTGNTIINFGGATSATNMASGVYLEYQMDVNVSYNTINNNNGNGVNHTSTLSGIRTGGNSSFATNPTILYNNITLHCASTSGDNIGAIVNFFGGSIYINNNTIFCTYPTTINVADMYGIYNYAPGSLYMNNNVISGLKTQGNSDVYGVANFGSPNLTIDCEYNHISNLTAGSGHIYAIVSGSAIGVCNVSNNIIDSVYSTSSSSSISITGCECSGNVEKNTVSNMAIIGTGTLYGIFAGYPSTNIHNNTVHSLSSSTGANIHGIYTNKTGSVIALNSIYNLHSSGGSGGITSGIYLVNSSGSLTNKIYKNKVSDITNTSSNPAVYGLYSKSSVSDSTEIYNNIIGNLNAPNSNASNPVSGIYIGGGNKCFLHYNTVYLNASSTGALFGSTALYTSTVPNITLCNNVLINTSVANGSGYTIAYRRKNTSLSTYNTASNNNFLYAGTPGAHNLIYHDSIITVQSLYLFKTTVAPCDSSSKTSTSIPNFISTTGTDSLFLHINPNIPTVLESGGKILTAYNNDYDGDIRSGSPGYPAQLNGGGTAPDIGADEFDGGNSYNCTTPSPGNTISSANPACSGQVFTLSLQNQSVGTGISYQWKSSPNGTTYTNITGADQNTYSTSCTGTMYFKCLVTCTNGPTSVESNPLQITVNPTLTASVSITANPAGAICTGTSVIFTATPVNGGTPTYQWRINGSDVTGETNSTYSSSSLANGNIVSCMMTSNASPCLAGSTATSNTITMQVNAIPATPVITTVSNYLHSSTAAGNQWYFNNGLISGATNQNYTPLQNGDYYVIVTVNGCASDTSNIITVVNVGIEESFAGNGIYIYPNPANDKITIISHQYLEIEITNMEGQIIKRLKLEHDKTEIDISSFAKGIYIVQAISDNGITTKKLIKE